MNTELRKRIEEAAELCQQYQEIYGGNFATAYMKGYADGYKEAIKRAKRWIEKYDLDWNDVDSEVFDKAMNKLWEEQK